MNIWQMSIQGAIMICVIVIIRALGFGKLPRWSFQALWACAVARLLLPFAIPSPLSLYGAVERVRAQLPPAMPEVTHVPLADYAVSAAPQAVAEAIAAPAPLSPWLVIWAVGAGLGLAWFVLSHLRGRRAYANAQTLSEGKLSGPLSRRVTLRSSGRVDAPLTYGIFRPVILIPARLAGESGLDCALAHELAHVRHWDALKKWVLAVALCAHWFNPLVWVLYVLANRDIELSCDERVLRAYGDRVRYATMLIDMEAQRAALTPMAAHFNRTAIEERIVAIMKYKKVSFIGIVLSIVLVIGTSAALATSAMPQAAEAVNEVIADSADPTWAGNLPTTGVATERGYSDPEEDAKIYAPYAPFGLTYDKQTQRLYYNGQLVRYFQDMTAFEDGSQSGMMFTQGDGSVDVYAVREKPADNMTQGALTGVKPYTQAEFDARTQKLIGQTADRDQNAVAMQSDTAGPVSSTGNIEWWTADEYAAWLAKEKVNLQNAIGSRGYTGSTGWFTWDQQKVNETIAMYEKILAEIKAGYKVSKTIDGRDDAVIQIHPDDMGTSVESGYDTAVGSAPVEALPADDIASDAFSGSILQPGETISFNRYYDASSGVVEDTASAMPAPTEAPYLSQGTATEWNADVLTSAPSATVTAVEDEWVASEATPGAPVLEAAADSVTYVDNASRNAAATYQAVLSLPDGTTTDLGTFESYVDRYEAVRDYCAYVVKQGGMTQAQADALVKSFK